MREHETILDALRRRAGSELSDILFIHLRNKRTAAVEHLKDGVAAGAGHGTTHELGNFEFKMETKTK
jgi:hypothetical protein